MAEMEAGPPESLFSLQIQLFLTLLVVHHIPPWKSQDSSEHISKPPIKFILFISEMKKQMSKKGKEVAQENAAMAFRVL